MSGTEKIGVRFRAQTNGPGRADQQRIVERRSAASDGLVLEGIHHAYGEEPVIRGVDLTVERGEILCLLGPSGCGKSTLLRVAAGLEYQTAGRVVISGEEVASDNWFVPPEKRRVGLMFQDYALFPHLSVIDNITFGLAGVERGSRREIAAALMERFSIDHLAASYPHELSGGEQQRVALARALAPHPAVMLLDEPLSALDERLREQVRDDALRFLEDEGVPTLMVTHDAEEALLMADRIALMRDGVLVQCGPPRQLCLEPTSPFVAQFFGALPAFEGRVRDHGVETPIGIKPCSFDEGCSVRVYVRPEALELIDDGSSNDSDLPTGRVLERRLLGSASQLRVLVNGCETPLSVRVADKTAPRVDDVVCIRFDPRRAFVFPASQDV